VDGIEWAVPLYKGQARAKLSFLDKTTGKRVDVIESVILIGLDDYSFVGEPASMFTGNIEDLRRPHSVVVDRVGLRKLFPRQGLNMIESPEALRADLARVSGRRNSPLTMSSAGRSVGGGETPGTENSGVTFESEGSPVLFELEMNERRAEVVGVCNATRTFQSNAIIYTTFSRAKEFVPRERPIGLRPFKMEVRRGKPKKGS
jgi:putative ABC transport system permease protein